MNTHLLSEVARVCTTIGVLNHGELIYKDSIEETTRRFPDEASLEDIYVRMEAIPG
jgi:ABC-2 type transport system ATP-binding protein